MAWIPIKDDEYWELYTSQESSLSVFSSVTYFAGGCLGDRYFPEDYIATTWGFADKSLPYIRSLKTDGKWHYWKWKGPAPQDNKWD